MPLTRRAFLKYSAGAATLLCLRPGADAAAAGQATILVNHVGFTPQGAKFCVAPGVQPLPFEVVETKSGKTVFRGAMQAVNGDLGQFTVGDFSELRQAGTFELHAGDSRSGVFAIGESVYAPSIQKSISYFAKQRCGDSKTGFNAPCHLDDGRRRDNGQHQDVIGGWHDACDLRKWVSATIYGMIGLNRLLDILPKTWDRAPILDELRWGNQYFHKMQEPDGYVMDYCGGDDGNNFTDNKIGTADDRLIHTDACELPAQFQFIAAQAATARDTRDADPEYARVCIEAATKCLTWCTEKRSPGAASSLGAGIMACTEMYRTLGGDRFRDQAAGYAHRLLSLQVGGDIDRAAKVRGFFLTAPDRPEPLREISYGNLPLLALCEALICFPDHADAKAWRRGLEMHALHLLALAERSAFGTVPFGLYAGKDPGGNRRFGEYWYRWFMKPSGENASSPDWWVGINAHLAAHGVGLIKASRLLNEPRLAALAQRQLDWILGVNPFNASTVTGVGRNQPRLYATSAFKPNTPLIPGGVVNGVGGNDRDEPTIDSGSYNTCEYWTPMVCYTMWLEAELEAAPDQ